MSGETGPAIASRLVRRRHHDVASAEALRIVRYGAVGASAAALYFVVALLAGYWTNLGVQAASALGLSVAASFAYFGHHRLTFAAKGDHRRYVPRFLATVLPGYAVSFILMRLLVDTGWLPYATAVVAVGATNAALSYGVNRFLVFTPAGDTARDPRATIEARHR